MSTTCFPPVAHTASGFSHRVLRSVSSLETNIITSYVYNNSDSNKTFWRVKTVLEFLTTNGLRLLRYCITPNTSFKRTYF